MSDRSAGVGELPTRVLKGHGCGNDFVIVPDVLAEFELDDKRVAKLCDRRFGIGGNGVLRVVPTRLSPEVLDQAAEAEWFMDYRNADGSRAQMCGNGIRVFARYLVEAGLAVPGRMAIATRGGVYHLVVPPEGDITVAMGVARQAPGTASAQVRVGERSWPLHGVDCPNPHAVVFVDTLDDAGALTQAPQIEPAEAFPEGVNVEFVVVHRQGHVSMRVHERGVGETLACGTGAVAVAWATARHTSSKANVWQIDQPGGRVVVSEAADGSLDLSGPAIVVASIDLRPDWWHEQLAAPAQG